MSGDSSAAGTGNKDNYEPDSRKKGTSNDWNHTDFCTDTGAPGSLSPVVAQPRLGIRTIGRRRHGSADRRRAGASRAPVAGELRLECSDVLRRPAGLSGRWAMNNSKKRVVRFLEKEIKTYVALSLFLSKKGTREPLQAGEKQALMHPAFYKERMKEARKLVTELRKSN